jgi:CheY-like chemotaxis protein
MAEGDRNGREVLVVDDDPSVTASLSLLLKQHGYQPRVAASPDEAAARLRRSRSTSCSRT